MQRCCAICQTHKPLEEFEKNPKKPHGRGYRCSECNRARRRKGWQSAERICPVCGKLFNHGKSSKKYCSIECNNAMEPVRYSNPRRYFQAALNPKRVAAGLTADDLLEILERQQGRCALTGREMTFLRGQGPVDTNCSIDRIDAGGAYTKENIQLVCSAVNGFRRNLHLETFVDWCVAVAEHSAKGGRR